MSAPHWYCRPCDAWFRQAEGKACPECGGALEERVMRYPEDVFGPPDDAPAMGEAPIADPTRRPNYPREEVGSQARGFGYLVIGHVVLALLGGALQGAIFFIGVVQMIYAVPMMIILAVQGQSATVSGVALGAGITFLLNAACFGLVCGTM